jgi:hypothetical protein
MSWDFRKKPDTRELVQDPSQAKARVLAELLKTCAHCQSGVSGHEFALLATWVITNERDEALLRFFETIKDHRWLELRGFQSWLGEADNLEAYAIRCAGNNLSVAVIKSHFELLLGSRLVCHEAVPPSEADALLEVFTDLRWYLL